MRKIILVSSIIICILILGIVLKNPILKIVYKVDYENYVDESSQKYSVDKYLIFAMIKAESNFDEDAISSKGARGLMQLMSSTGLEVAEGLEMNITEEDILIPEINIILGTKYISLLINKYECVELALAAYNAGSGNVDNWIDEGILEPDGSNIENIPYTETNNYVRKILRDYDIYRSLYIEKEG